MKFVKQSPEGAKLHVGRPNIGNREHFFDRMGTLLDNVWLTNNGLFVQEFENKIAEFLGVKHCIATCNGTLALELAVRALDLKGEVIVPSLTFVATAHALQWQEIKPVFCDIDPDTCCIAPGEVERLITQKTSGIIGVHLYGRPCAIDQLYAIARQHNLKLLFDAAHAFGCSYKGNRVGVFGACEVFSFHATKVLNTFEGGAVATNDDELASKIRLMKNFGFAGEDKVIYIGTNGKMTEMSAAMGVTNLESFYDFVEVNRRHWQTYCQGVRDVAGIELLPYDETQQNNYQYVVIKVDAGKFGMSRDKLKERLACHDILARRYFYPGCHRMEPYLSLFPKVGDRLPHTEKMCSEVLILPTGTQATTEQIEAVCSLIRDIHLDHYGQN